ncbi:MAG: hypothetical protein WA959_33805, partial [Rivularia sp. (in: cyanobacteria)]
LYLQRYENCTRISTELSNGIAMGGQKVINYMANNKQTVLFKVNSTVDAFIISHHHAVRMLL